MKKFNPESVVLSFNDCINNQDIKGLASLMSDDHVFVDRDGSRHGPKSYMVEGWKDFFSMFPDYRNTFLKIITRGNQVLVTGYAYWSKEEPKDEVIWVATLANGLVQEWRIYADNEENRKALDIN